MDSIQTAIVKNTLGTFVLVSTFLGLTLFFRIRYARRLHKFPLLEVRTEKSTAQRIAAWLGCPDAIYGKTSEHCSDTFHRVITQDGENVVIPNKYLDEIKTRPDSEIAVLPAAIRNFESKYTHLYPPKEDFELVIAVARVELTRRLSKINSKLSADVAQAIRTALPSSTDWTPVNVYPAILHAVASITGSVLMGPELCRSPEYIRAAVDYTVDVFQAGEELKQYPAVLKPLISLFSSKGGQVRKHRRDLTTLLAPIVAERKRLLAQGSELPEDGLSWIIRLAVEKGMADVKHVVNVQLYLIVASVHTTTSFMTRALHDLAAHPETIEELRTEIRRVLAENDGIMTPKALHDMTLTDSFMKESQRLSPAFLATFMRRTEKPITLKDGTHIPSHTYLETSHSILRDPALYPDPEKLDPHRFHRLRTEAAAADDSVRRGAQWQFSSVTREHMGFGFGRHACPGRFFAANEIKLILARVLLDYDVVMPPDAEPDAFASVAVGVQNVPELKRGILVRRAAAREA
ncbi:unnamed protein product [Discula destructiva]